jgi:hypothetical protein
MIDATLPTAPFSNLMIDTDDVGYSYRAKIGFGDPVA